MLTNDDVQKIIKANLEVFYAKEDIDKKFDEMKESFSSLQTSVDSFAKKSDTYFQEMLLLSRKVDRQEAWIHQIAEKIGVQLKY